MNLTDKINIIEEYFNIKANDKRCQGIGCYNIAPIILMVNDEEKIVKELLEDSEFDAKSNMTSFFEHTYRVIKEQGRGTNNILIDLRAILGTFNEIENKWSINSEEFAKEVLKRL